MGIPVDATTGNLVGSVPQLLQFQNGFLPAQPTTQIQYRANLASYPLTAGPRHQRSAARNCSIPTTFSANPIAGAPVAAKIIGFGAQLAGCVAGVTGTGTFAAPLPPSWVPATAARCGST